MAIQISRRRKVCATFSDAYSHLNARSSRRLQRGSSSNAGPRIPPDVRVAHSSIAAIHAPGHREGGGKSSEDCRHCDGVDAKSWIPEDGKQEQRITFNDNTDGRTPRPTRPKEEREFADASGIVM